MSQRLREKTGQCNVFSLLLKQVASVMICIIDEVLNLQGNYLHIFDYKA